MEEQELWEFEKSVRCLKLGYSKLTTSPFCKDKEDKPFFLRVNLVMENNCQ